MERKRQKRQQHVHPVIQSHAALAEVMLGPREMCMSVSARTQPNSCLHQLFTSHINRHAATEGIRGSTTSACIPTTSSLPPAPTTLTHPTRHGTTTTKLLITRSTHTSQNKMAASTPTSHDGRHAILIEGIKREPSTTCVANHRSRRWRWRGYTFPATQG